MSVKLDRLCVSVMYVPKHKAVRLIRIFLYSLNLLQVPQLLFYGGLHCFILRNIVTVTNYGYETPLRISVAVKLGTPNQSTAHLVGSISDTGQFSVLPPNVDTYSHVVALTRKSRWRVRLVTAVYRVH